MDQNAPALGVPNAPEAPGQVSGMFDRALDLVFAGGPVVAILLVMSVVALAVIILKLWQFRSVKLSDRRSARRAVALHRAGKTREAFSVAAGSTNPVTRVIALAIGGRLRGDLAEHAVREEVARFAADLLDSLRAYLRPLEVIATLAPLLGLFGTVLGMIDAFQQLEQAGSRVNPAVLSGGIWEALLTTAVGLGVAIPAVAVLNWLERIVDRVAHDMEDGVAQIFAPDLTAVSTASDHELPQSATRLRAAAAAGE
ncbi:MAG: MotA/TolQ/ExbB proton channel family protein [Rhodospirillales bacterium]